MALLTSIKYLSPAANIQIGFCVNTAGKFHSSVGHHHSTNISIMSVASDDLENLEQQLARLNKDLIFFERELRTETNSFCWNLLVEHLRNTSQARLDLTRRIVALQTSYVENLERALCLIKEKRKN